jgi:uncharacterized protein (TIGR03435 family)
MDEKRWDIVAKMPDLRLAPGAQPIGNQRSISLMLMLQSLLKDRFKLQVHYEDVQKDGYALVADKPKLRKTADPSARPECKDGPGPDGKDPRIANPNLSRLVTCLNMTMAQFSAQLKSAAREYLNQYPDVVDETGIDGAYDITLNFSPIRMFNAGVGGVPPQAPGADLAASEPNGAISLFDALKKQLGLELKSRKLLAAHVLVIDHAEDAPIELP